MILSKPARYAVRALIFLAEHRGQGPILSSAIAAKESLPASYLVKILGALTVAGYVVSTRGPGGGFALAKDPAQIRLLDIVSVFEEELLSNHDCLLGVRGCVGGDHCEIYKRLMTAVSHSHTVLRETTIGDLARESSHHREKLQLRENAA